MMAHIKTLLLALMVMHSTTLFAETKNTSNTPALSVTQVRELSQQNAPHPYVFVDVRSSKEFASGHVKGAINIPVRELHSRLGELDSHRNKTLVVYCEVGGRAAFARLFLEQNGFTTTEMTGHMRAWRKQ